MVFYKKVAQTHTCKKSGVNRPGDSREKETSGADGICDCWGRKRGGFLPPLLLNMCCPCTTDFR